MTSGDGIIDGYAVNTYNDQTFSLSANSEFRVYSVRKIGTFGMAGPRSDVGTAIFTKTVLPATPTSILTELEPFSITISWTANTELDLDHYSISRSDDGITYYLLADTEEIEYVDTTVEEDTTYYYRLTAVDESSFSSTPATLTLTTPLDTALPPPPNNIRLIPSGSSINVLWDYPLTLEQSKVQNFILDYVQLNSDDSEIAGTEETVTIPGTQLYHRIDYLADGSKYQVAVQLEDIKGRISSAIDQKQRLTVFSDVLDPPSLSYSTEEAANGVKLNLQWSAEDDPYLDPDQSNVPFAYRIYVTIKGQQESQAIDVPINLFAIIDGNPFVQYSISLYSFDLLEYLPIPENTYVSLRVTSLSKTGIESSGNYINLLTPNYQPPSRITNLSATFDKSTGKITSNWSLNSETASVQMLVTDTTTSTIVYNANLGLVSHFELDSLVLGDTYSFSVTPIGYNGISGTASIARVDAISEQGTTTVPVEVPEAPTSVTAQAGDRQVSLNWVDSDSSFTASYKIYRMTGAVIFDYTEWELVDTIPVQINQFVDYGLENGQMYSYYVTSVDIYGRESEHLANEVINLNYVEVTPDAQGLLTEPTDLTVTMFPATHSVEVEWQASLGEEFDAYRVWRSVGNLHSWTIATTLDKNTTIYTDTGFPLINGTSYYYTVEKTVNDAEIRVQTSTTAPQNSILLGAVTTSFSSMTIDVTGRHDVANLEYASQILSAPYILNHRHIEDLTKLSTTVDKLQTVAAERIRLDENLIITNWTTKDGVVWTTDELDLIGVSYSVRVNGQYPGVFYTFDPINGELTFSEPIISYDSNGNVIGTLPTVELTVYDVTEVQNTLATFRFDDIHATQVAYGKIAKEQIPELNHDGRVKEILNPKSFLLQRYNDNTFIVPEGNTDTTKNFGEAVTFYSMIDIGNVLAAGTSQGLMTSEDFGSTWTVTLLTRTPVHKFYKTSYNDFTWAISADQVFMTQNGITWYATSGTSGVQYIQDIVADTDGNMFISSDKGVYFLEISLIYQFNSWIQTNIINAFSSQCYGMYTVGNVIYVSTENGIYNTSNKGTTWTFTGMLTENLPVFQFIKDGTDIYGITKKHLLKKISTDSDFAVLVDLETDFNITDVWCFEIFNGYIYISTEKGVYSGTIGSTTFDKILPQVNEKNITRTVFLLNKIWHTDVYQLFVGVENTLFVMDIDNTVSIKCTFNKELPSFFLNETQVNIGYTYNTFNSTLVFREPVDVFSTLSAAYLPRKTFYTEFGGWVETKPDAEIFIYMDGQPVWVDFALDQTTFTSNLSAFQATLTSLPTLDDYNSFLPDSTTYLASLLQQLGTIVITDSAQVLKFFQDASKFISLLTPTFIETNNLSLPAYSIVGTSSSSRSSTSRAAILTQLGLLADISGTAQIGSVDFPVGMTSDSTGITINGTTGEIVFPGTFSKYNDLKITLFGTTFSNAGLFSHRELEDFLEQKNTGLTSNLASTAYTNLIKLGIGLETQQPGFSFLYPTSPVQNRFYSANNAYWYDVNNSTIDFDLIVESDAPTVSLFVNCLVSITYDDPYDVSTLKIWAGTDNCILQYIISSDTLVLESVIWVNGENVPLNISDILVQSETEIYVVATDDYGQSSIYLTADMGLNWTPFLTTNLPNRIYKITKINNTQVVATETGLYFCDNTYGYWRTTNLDSTDTAIMQAFRGKCLNLENNNSLIAEFDRSFYRSGSGTDWTYVGGTITENEVSVVNKIKRLQNITYVATDQGLYSDAGTIMSDSASFGLESTDGLLYDLHNCFNDMTIGSHNELYAVSSAGSVYRFYDEDDTGNVWTSLNISEQPLHKVLFVSQENDEYLVASSYNQLTLLSITI